MTQTAFGKALAEGRAMAGFPNQACLARATGLQATEINRYERGTALPSLQRFALLTGVGIDPLPLLAVFDPEPAPPAEQ